MFHESGVLFSGWIRFSGKKSCLFKVESSRPDFGVTLPSCHFTMSLWRKGDEDYFSPKLRARIKDKNNSPHGKFHRFLFPFPCKFSDLNFASYVLYICPFMSRDTQWAWVTYGRTTRSRYKSKGLFTWKWGASGKWGPRLWWGNQSIYTISLISWSRSHVRWGTPLRWVTRSACPGNPLQWSEFSLCESCRVG